MNSSFTQMFEVSRTGLMWRMLDLDVVSNNLGNINTTGYKQQRLNFNELLNAASLETDVNQDGEVSHEEAQNLLYNGIQVLSTQMLPQQGALQNTGRPLDTAISGEGFYAFTLGDGSLAYSRDGELKLDENNLLINGKGYPLVWEGTIPEDAVEVSIDQIGRVYGKVDGVTEVYGNIELYRFATASGLSSYGDNLWLESESSGAATAGIPSEDGFGKIISGNLESSNVNMTEEFTRMISLQRGFEMSIQALQQADNMLNQAVHVRR